MNLDFLKDVKLEPVAKATPKTRTTTPSIPEKGDLRVFKNGRIYPSEDFAKRYNLEFQPKVNIAEEGQEPIMEIVGNGLEIFSSLEWTMIKGKLPEELIFCCAVPKRLPKVDMWASTKYEADNTPKASVFTQGANTFAKTRLVPMLAEVYAIDWENTEYVDLKVVEDTVMPSPTGVYTLPKKVSTGAKKGQPDYMRRENLTICPLVVEHIEVLQDIPESKKDVISEVKAEEGSKSEVSVDEDSNKEEAPAKDWAEQLGS